MDGDKRPAEAPNQEPGWVFKPGPATATPPSQSATTPVAPAEAVQPEAGDSVEWTASEFIAHEKSFGWYFLFTVAICILAGLVYLLTKDEISTAVVLVAGLIFGIAAARKPRILAYRLDDSGLTIGRKFYPYGLFKSFTIFEEGPFASIVFLPIKRFMPAYSVYFAPNDEQKIMDILTIHLPYEQRNQGLFDSLVHRIRF